MQLTTRAEKIIRILIRSPHGKPMAAAAISESLDISRRSVQRELPTVEKWLNEQGFTLIRKPGSGLYLDEPAERLEELMSLLNQYSPTDLGEDRTQRQKILRRELLAAEEPLKTFYFTELLGISEKTLSTDLDQIEKWLQKYHLTLVRRQGLGIFVDGSETNKRQAISSIICDQMGQQQLISLLRNDSIADTSPRIQFMEELDSDIKEHVERVLSDCEKQLGLQFSDSSYVSLFVHISLAIQRLKAGETIQIEPEELRKLKILPEYAVGEHVVSHLRKELNIRIPSDEAAYIAMHLTGARIWPGSRKSNTQAAAINVRQTALAIMDIVGQEMNIDFRSDESLMEDLCTHIQPTIGRLSAGIPIENPELQNLISNYADIYHACEKGMQVLKELLELSEIPASEVGFVAMHFGAALERRQNQLMNIAVVIVCPTGIGTSRLLAARLKREYPQLEIREVMSAFALDADYLKQTGIDLVISTVKLRLDFPHLCVNPMMTIQDKMLLGTAIDSLIQQKKEIPIPKLPAASNAALTRDTVNTIKALGEEIYALLGNLRIHQAPIIHNRRELIEESGKIFADSEEAVNGIRELFFKRDNLADTYIKPFYALLLHGVSPYVQSPCLGYVRLSPPFYENGKKMWGAILMLIPEGSNQKICAKIVSEISGLLLEMPNLLTFMRSGQTDELQALLEQHLLRFYKREVQNILDLK